MTNNPNFTRNATKRVKFNPGGQLICCRECGRDTRSADGFCYRCIGRYGNQIEDRTDRPALATIAEDNQAIGLNAPIDNDAVIRAYEDG